MLLSVFAANMRTSNCRERNTWHLDAKSSPVVGKKDSARKTPISALSKFGEESDGGETVVVRSRFGLAQLLALALKVFDALERTLAFDLPVFDGGLLTAKRAQAPDPKDGALVILRGEMVEQTAASPVTLLTSKASSPPHTFIMRIDDATRPKN
jgi:hypothetical protein